MGPDGERPRSVAEQLGDDLRGAFAALGSASITADQRVKFQRRLLAITTAAKRDVRTSSSSVLQTICVPQNRQLIRHKMNEIVASLALV